MWPRLPPGRHLMFLPAAPSRAPWLAASGPGRALPAPPPLQAASLLPPGQWGKLRRKAAFPATLQVEMRRRPLLSTQAWPAAFFSPSLPQCLPPSKFEARRISSSRQGDPAGGGEEGRRQSEGKRRAGRTETRRGGEQRRGLEGTREALKRKPCERSSVIPASRWGWVRPKRRGWSENSHCQW